ncbi:hypothetical protein [Treponema saccharophilum]|uniref:Uncharacterized protein n=1 Tax=Treponema saccharophilum DSM 2985 TaxID=907348 RepID=H7EPQ8_9SPIR|nr:hypothetical protein [Treponema saccharophilum]EIC00459.1 hypothetical protein TresaDRAFT_0553 [Treponema saccharophilum DSM 2985]BDC94995.1 hypothetical protein TRSA_00940 [Treponema saccharophilum]
MLFVKIIVAVIAIALILISIAAPNDGKIDVPFFFELGIFPGVACIPLDIALWGNFRVLFIISIILLAISIVGIIVAYIINKISVAKIKAIKAKVLDLGVLTSETMESIPLDLLYSANFFISGSLGFIKYDSSKPALSVDLKSLENMIVIGSDTKGKLMAANNGMVEILFETARKSCTLYFKTFEHGEDAEYLLCKKDGSLILSDRKITLDNEEYKVVPLFPPKYEKLLWENRIQNFTNQDIANKVHDDIENCTVFGWEELIFYPPTLQYEWD